MPPRLAAVAGLPRLGLLPLTPVPPDVPVSWVAVSELEDPTAYLEGGELLLTTGMRLTDASAGEYLSRLVERGVAGLGFGVGVVHETVPAALILAAQRHGLPLLEVPRATPFIAVGKAVSRMLAAEWYEDVTRAFQAQRALSRAALDGPSAVIARLARELGGWALLLDAAGTVQHAEPSSAAARAPALAPDLNRLRPPKSGSGVAGSLSLVDGDAHVVVQGIGPGDRPRGFLAIGTSEPLPHVAHTIVGAAAALLTLRSETPRSGRGLRAALAAALLDLPSPERAVPRFPASVLACANASVADALEADPLGDRCLALARPGHVVVIAPAADARRVAALADGPVGVSEPAASAADLGTALSQAETALSASRRTGSALAYGELPGQGLLGVLDPELARGFADTLLAPLRDEPSLEASLRAFLAAGGRLEEAARDLDVHRHTLRHRVRRIGDLLGRDLDDPGVRAELWVALAVTANDAPPIGRTGASGPG
ncbi:PucR family transcriptional regulator [Actinomadura rupiterrae]|uniref:PucR family transcriptional regulator n=1 Tax=Actinomadura rupiterrae TaxID=559627 RepID=UPI0020A3C315|nr:PucR family transcriptional regulator [Actinomadura rupiterrae]MCP2341847.1 purine catabolism regulator [Actinomadura rupiterrae]